MPVGLMLLLACISIRNKPCMREKRPYMLGKGKKRWQDLAAKSDCKLHVGLARCSCLVNYLAR